ncbi:MAG: hypothetical protein Q8M69_04280 [Reyranella sp.]|nr:hypothetical protein [Reyranella sp.]
MAALAGACIGAGLMAMGLAILFTAIWGPFEGSAAMGGVTVGLPLGGLLGFGLGGWLLLRFWKPAPRSAP